MALREYTLCASPSNALLSPPAPAAANNTSPLSGDSSASTVSHASSSAPSTPAQAPSGNLPFTPAAIPGINLESQSKGKSWSNIPSPDAKPEEAPRAASEPTVTPPIPTTQILLIVTNEDLSVFFLGSNGSPVFPKMKDGSKGALAVEQIKENAGSIVNGLPKISDLFKADAKTGFLKDFRDRKRRVSRVSLDNKQVALTIFALLVNIATDEEKYLVEKKDKYVEQIAHNMLRACFLLNEYSPEVQTIANFLEVTGISNTGYIKLFRYGSISGNQTFFEKGIEEGLSKLHEKLSKLGELQSSPTKAEGKITVEEFNSISQSITTCFTDLNVRKTPVAITGYLTLADIVPKLCGQMHLSENVTCAHNFCSLMGFRESIFTIVNKYHREITEASPEKCYSAISARAEKDEARSDYYDLTNVPRGTVVGITLYAVLSAIALTVPGDSPIGHVHAAFDLLSLYNQATAQQLSIRSFIQKSPNPELFTAERLGINTGLLGATQIVNFKQNLLRLWVWTFTKVEENQSEKEKFFQVFGEYLLEEILKEKTLDNYNPSSDFGNEAREKMQFSIMYLLHKMEISPNDPVIRNQAASVFARLFNGSNSLFLSNGEKRKNKNGAPLALDTLVEDFYQRILAGTKKSVESEPECCTNAALCLVLSKIAILDPNKTTSDTLLACTLDACRLMKQYNDKSGRPFDLHLFNNPRSLRLGLDIPDRKTLESLKRNLLRAYEVAAEQGQKAAILEAFGDYLLEAFNLVSPEEITNLVSLSATGMPLTPAATEVPSVPSATGVPSTPPPPRRRGSPDTQSPATNYESVTSRSMSLTPSKIAEVTCAAKSENVRAIQLAIDYLLPRLADSNCRNQATCVIQRLFGKDARNVIKVFSEREDKLNENAIEFCKKVLATTKPLQAQEVDICAYAALYLGLSRIIWLDYSSKTGDKDLLAHVLEACSLIAQYKTDTKQEKFEFGLLDVLSNFGFPKLSSASFEKNLLRAYGVATDPGQRAAIVKALGDYFSAKLTPQEEVFSLPPSAASSTSPEPSTPVKRAGSANATPKKSSTVEYKDGDEPSKQLMFLIDYSLLTITQSHNSSVSRIQAASVAEKICDGAQNIFRTQSKGKNRKDGLDVKAVEFCTKLLETTEQVSAGQKDVHVVDVAAQRALNIIISKIPLFDSSTEDKDTIAALVNTTWKACELISLYKKKTGSESEFDFNFFNNFHSDNETLRSLISNLLMVYAIAQRRCEDTSAKDPEENSKFKNDLEIFFATFGCYLLTTIQEVQAKQKNSEEMANRLDAYDTDGQLGAIWVTNNYRILQFGMSYLLYEMSLPLPVADSSRIATQAAVLIKVFCENASGIFLSNDEEGRALAGQAIKFCETILGSIKPSSSYEAETCVNTAITCVNTAMYFLIFSRITSLPSELSPANDSLLKDHIKYAFSKVKEYNEKAEQKFNLNLFDDPSSIGLVKAPETSRAFRQKLIHGYALLQADGACKKDAEDFLCTSGEYLFDKELQKKIDSEKGEVTEDELIFAMNYLVYKKTEAEKALKEVKNHSDFGTALNDSLICGAEQRLDGVMQMARALMVKIYGFHGDNQDVFAANSELKKASEDFCFAMFQDADYVKDYFADKSNSDDDSGAIANAFRYFMGQLVQCKQKLQVTPAFASPSGETHSSSVDSRSYGQIVLESLLLRVKPSARSEYSCSYEGIELLLKSYAGNYATEKCKKGDDNKSVSICLASRALGVGLTGWADLAENLKPPVSPGSKASATEFTKMQTPDFTQLSNLNKYVDVILQGYPRMESGAQEAKEAFIRQNIFAFLKKNPINIADIPQICQLLAVANVDIGDYFSPKLKPEEIGWLSKEGLCGPFAMIYYESQIVLQKSSIIRKRRFNDFCKFCRNTNTDPEFLLHNFDREAADYLLYCCQLPDSEKAAHFGKVFNKYPPNSCNIGKFEKLQVSFEMISPQAFLYYKGDPKVNFEKISPQAIVVEQILGSSDKLTDPKYLPQKIKTCMQNALIQAAKESSNDEAKIFLLMVSTKLSLLSLFPIDKKEVDAAFTWLREKCGSLAVPGKCWGASEKEMFVAAIFAQEPFTEEHFAIFKQLNIEPGTLQSAFSKLVLVDKSKGSKIALFLLAKSENDLLERLDRIVPPETDIYIDQGNFKSYPLALFNMIVWHNHIIAANPNTAIRESIVRNLCEVDPQFYVNILRNLDITKHNSEGAVKELFDCFCSIAISTKDQCLRKKVDQIVEAINAEIFNPALQKEIKKNYEIYQYRCNFDLYFGKRDFEKILKIQEAPEAIEKQQFVSKILYFLAKEHIEPSNVQGDVLVKEYLNYLNNLSKNQPDNRYHELLVDILKFGQLCETFNEIAVKLLLPILQERLLEDPSSKIPLDDVAKFYCSLRPEFRGTEKAKLFANRLLTQADVLSKLTSEVRTYFLATFRTDLEQQGVPEAEIRQQLGNWFRFLANLVKAGTLRHPVFAVHEPPFNFVYIDNRGGSKELRKVIVDADLVASFNHSIVIWGVQQEDFADIFARLPGMMSAVLNEEGQYKGILPALRGQHVLKLFLLYNTLAATDQDIRTRIVEIFIMGICKPNDEVALEAAYNLLGADNLFDISTSIAERIRIHHSETADDRTNALNNVSKLGSFGALILVQLYLNEDNEGYSKAIFTKLLEDPLCLSAVNYLSDHKNEEMSKRLFYALCLRKSLNLYQPDASIKNVILPYWNHLVSDKQTAEEKKIVDDFVKDFKVDELKNYCELCKQDAQNGLFALLYRQFVLFDTQVRSCPKSTKDKNEHVFEVLATQGDKGDINFLDFVKDNLDKFTSSQVQRICGIIWQSFLNKEESKDIAWFNANILPIYRSFMENHPRTRFINGDAALTPLQFKYLIRIVAFIDLEKQAMPGGMRVDMHVDPLYGALLRELILRRELTREGADLLSLSIAFNTAFVEQLDGIPQSEEGAGAKQVQLKERMHDVILFIASEYLYNREMSERDRKLVKQFLGNVLANLPQPFASEKGALQTEISKAEGAAVNAAYDFIYDRDWYSRSSAPVENDVVKKKERAEQFIDDTYVHSPDGALSRNIRIYRDYKVQRIVQPNLQLQYEANEKDPEDKNLAYSQLQSVQAMVASQRASASNSVLVASTASGLGLRRQPSSREQQQSNSSWFAALRSYAYYWIESAKTWRRFSKLDSERAKIFQDEEVKKAEAAEKPVRGRSTDARVVIGKSSARSASPSPVRQPVASGSGTGNRSPSPSGTRRKALPPLRKSTLLPPAASSHALSPGDDRKVEVASSHDPKGSEKDAADASDHVVIHKSREETRPDSASPVLEQSDKPINTGSIMKSFDSGSETGRRSPLPPLRRRSPSPSPTRVLRPRPVRHQLHSREGSDSSWSWHSFLSLFSCLLPGCLANVVNSHNDSNGESKPLLKS